CARWIWGKPFDYW
nr:immunoglobulin heavy chain junction region [Mus musculus]MBK4195588.1 immunoglobulin heavy chain junction region [Mus musculus]